MKHKIIMCPKNALASRINSEGRFRHMLVKTRDVPALLEITKPEFEELNILSEGYICTCGIVIGIAKSGELMPLCKFEMQ